MNGGNKDLTTNNLFRHRPCSQPPCLLLGAVSRKRGVRLKSTRPVAVKDDGYTMGMALVVLMLTVEMLVLAPT